MNWFFEGTTSENPRHEKTISKAFIPHHRIEADQAHFTGFLNRT